MPSYISNEKLSELKSLKGQVRGSGVQEVVNSIKQREGEEAVDRLEKALNEAGYSIRFAQIKPMDFYPLGMGAVIYTLIKEMFNYTDQDFQEMGRFESRISFIIKLFLKYFFSIDRVVQEVPKMWNKYYTIGSLEVDEFDEEARYAKLVLKDFNYVPMVCEVFKGYFPSILGMIVGKEARCKETSCPYNGDEYHEFLIEW
ncbi:MAG: hypothetical protein GF370_02915 [Candidatus Nealsonbacteria bacterium]|nr:hypothetical protein [Candidatus Nealsonbacteria bacterium]